MTHVVGDPGHTADHNTIEATQATHTTQIAALPGTYPAAAIVAAATGNDGAQLRTACTGTAEVYLTPGAVYHVTDTTTWPAFSGKVYGRGATISFDFAGPYTADAIIHAWTDVEVVGVTFTGAALEHSIFGSGCARLTFRKIGVYDLTFAFCDPIDSDLAVYDSRWYQSGAPPASVNQTIQGPNGGKFIVDGCRFDFAPTSGSGAIVGTIASVPTQGSEVHITHNAFLATNAAGFTIDAAVDIEPGGTVGYELVNVADNTIYNASVYLSGGRRLNAHRNVVRFTSVRAASPRMIPFIIFNSLGTQPATGVVDIADNEVIQDAVAASYDTHLWKFSIPVTEVRSRDNRILVNASTTGAVSLWEAANTSERVVIDGDRVVNSSATVFAGQVAARFDFLPSKAIEMRNTKINGKWFAVIGSQTGAAQTCGLLRLNYNDFTEMTVNGGLAPAAGTYLYNDTFGTFTATQIGTNMPGPF